MPRANGAPNVESVLLEYSQVAPDNFIGELPEESSRWLEVCEGQEVTPEQQFSVAWLNLEVGFGELHAFDRIRGIRGSVTRGKTSQVAVGGKRQTKARHFMQRAESQLAELETGEGVPEYIIAQAALTRGALPLIEAARASNVLPWKLQQQQEDYRLAQARSIEVMDSAIQTGELSQNELAFVRMLASIAIGNNLVGSTTLILPAPPRCYEGRPFNESWHCLLYDPKRNREKQVAISKETTLPEAYPMLQNDMTDDEINAEAVQLVSELRTAIHDEDHAIPPESLLGVTVEGWASMLSELTQRKLKSLLILPDYTAVSAHQNVQPEETAEALDLEPIHYPSINFDLLSSTNLLTWYSGQNNGRALSEQEGLQLNRAIEAFCRANQGQPTMTDELALDRLRLECAQALPDRASTIAEEHLDLADQSLRRTTA